MDITSFIYYTYSKCNLESAKCISEKANVQITKNSNNVRIGFRPVFKSEIDSFDQSHQKYVLRCCPIWFERKELNSYSRPQ